MPRTTTPAAPVSAPTEPSRIHPGASADSRSDGTPDGTPAIGSCTDPLIMTPPWDDKTAPHGWIQWKGTNVCMDFRCPCGALTHLDADFAYAVTCGACGQSFALNGHVRAYPIDPAAWDGCEPQETEC